MNDILLSGKQDADTNIFLSTSSRGTQPINAGLGVLLVSVQNVTPYLSGYQLTLSVDNPNFATYSQNSVVLLWGPSAPNTPTYTFKKNLVSDFLPGTWTPVTLILTPATPKDLEYLNLSLQSSEIKLYNSSSPTC